MKTAQITIGDTSFTKLHDGFIQILTKNGCVELVPEEIAELSKFVTPEIGKEETVEEDYESLKLRCSKMNEIEAEATMFSTLNFDKGCEDSPLVAAYEGVLHGIQWQKETTYTKQEVIDIIEMMKSEINKMSAYRAYIDEKTIIASDISSLNSEDFLKEVKK